MKKLSWKPVRKGLTYCSPACGRGCTRKEFNAATKSGNALAESIGVGWKPRVWENLGWHFEAISPCKRLNVNNVYGSFTAYLGDGKNAHFVEDGKTAKAAIKYVVGKARERMQELGKLIERL